MREPQPMPTISDLLVRVRADTTEAVGSLGALGLGMAGVGVGAGVAAAAMVKMGMDAQNQLAIVQGLAGVSAKQMDSYTTSLETMSTTYGSTLSESAKGLYYVVSAGFSGANALNVLKYSMEASKASGAALADVTHSLAGTMNAYGATASQAGQYQDMMTGAVTYGMQTFSQFSSVIGNGAAAAAAYHIPFDQLAAAEASVTDKGIQAGGAVAGIVIAMQKVEVPADVMAKTVKAAGGTLDQTAYSSASFVDKLVLLEQHSGLSVTAFEKIVGGARSGRAALDLASDGGAKYVDTLKKIDAAHGLTDAAFKTHDATLVGGMEDVGAAVSVLGFKFVTMITPTVGPMLAGLAKDLANLPTALNAIGTAIAPVTTAIGGLVNFIASHEVTLDLFKGALIAVGGAFLAIKTIQTVSSLVSFAATLPGLITGLLSTNITLFGTSAAATAAAVAEDGAAVASVGLNIALGPLGLIILGLALAIGGLILLITHWSQVTAFLGNVWKDVVGVIQDVWKWFNNLSDPLKLVISLMFPIIPLVEGIVYAITHWSEIIHTLQSDFSAIWPAITGFVASAINTIIGWFNTAYNHSYTFKAIVDFVVSTFHFFQKANAEIWAAITAIWIAATGYIARVATAWWNAQVAEFNTIKGVLVGVVNAIWTAISAAFNVAVGVVRGIVQFLWRGVVMDFNFAERLVSAVMTPITNAIINPLKNLGGAMLQAGKDLIQGLINGVESMIGNLGKTIGDIGNSIPGWVKNPLQIHSPSGVFADIGANIAQGLINGFTGVDIQSAVVDHLAKLTGIGFGVGINAPSISANAQTSSSGVAVTPSPVGWQVPPLSPAPTMVGMGTSGAGNATTSGTTTQYVNHFYGTNLTAQDVVKEQLWQSMLHGS